MLILRTKKPTDPTSRTEKSVYTFSLKQGFLFLLMIMKLLTNLDCDCLSEASLFISLAVVLNLFRNNTDIYPSTLFSALTEGSDAKNHHPRDFHLCHLPVASASRKASESQRLLLPLQEILVSLLDLLMALFMRLI
jgi:hypothetical protein